MDERELWRADPSVVAELRAARGWTRARLALAAGVSPHTAARIERGEAVYPATLAAVADALGVPAHELRAVAEKALAPSRRVRTLLDAYRDSYAAYKTALGRADRELVRNWIADSYCRNGRHTYAPPPPIPFGPPLFSRDEIARRFVDMIDGGLTVEWLKVERVDPVGPRELLVRGNDSALFGPAARARGSWIQLVEYDRRGKIVRSHMSVVEITIEPAVRGVSATE